MRLVKKILIPILVLVFIFSIFLIISYFLNRNSGKGALQVTSVPKSKVYVDGKLIGETPLCKCEYPNMLDVGQHDIKLIPQQEGLDSFEEKIIISSSVLTVVDRTFGNGALSEGSVITLNKIADKNDAQLLIISFPDNVQVFLNNSLIGNTPIALKNQTESDHEIKLTKEGYKDKIIRIRAIKGYRLEATTFLAIGQTSTQSAQPTQSPLEPTPTAAVKLTKVTISQTPTGFLRVRDNSSLAGNQIGEVKPGEIYDLLNETAGWYQIKLEDGKIGWISSQYATKE